MLLAGAFAFAGEQDDPLDHVSAYSLCLSSEGPLPGYFPIGISGGSCHLLTHAGFNMSESQVCHYGWKDGQPMPPPVKQNQYGTGYFVNSWAAHTFYNSRETKHHGTIPNGVSANGKEHGGMGICLFHPQVWKYLKDYNAALAKRWGQADPLARPILMWGLDNEWEGYLDYSKWAKDAFYAWLKKAYDNDIQALNAGWGTQYENFEQAEPPVDEPHITRPGAWLDWHACQEENFTDLVAELYEAIWNNDPRHRPVALKTTQMTLAYPVYAKRKVNNHALLAEKTRQYGGLHGIDIYGSGDTMSYKVNYIYNCVRFPDLRPGCGVFLPETNNHSGPGWQWAATYWRALNNGLKAVDYFVAGGFGAKGDYDTYGFVSPIGKPRDKMFYAARWAHMVHRTETLWKESVPAQDIPRVAILHPRRDLLLADNPEHSCWAFPANNSRSVYIWLREQGYWVDIIPYTKLTPAYLKAYDALVLINAEHLKSGECRSIREYVKAGGVLVADTRPGFFDEHHRERHGLDECLGSEITGLSNNASDIWFLTDGGVIRGDFLVSLKPKRANVLAHTTRHQIGVLMNQYGKGKVIHFATKLGLLRPETPAPLLVSNWLGALLKQNGVHPAYRVAQASSAGMRALRIEQPYVDAKGNCVFTVGNLSKQTVPPTVMEMPLPAGPWTHAWWAPAEHDGLQELMIEPIGKGRYRVLFPSVLTAGAVYLLRDHAPILGIARIAGETTSVDGHTALLAPGKPFRVKVQMVNPVARTIPEGTLRFMAVRGWRVKPPTVPTPKLTSYGRAEFEFTVTAPGEHEKLKPDWLYPLVARWNDGKQDAAICSANVEVDVDRSRLPHLLSENANYPDAYPAKLDTGATYTYLAPGKDTKWGDPCTRNKHRTGNALTNGSGGWGNYAIFHRANLVDVLFDLKAEYEVMQVKIAKCAQAYPRGFTVLTSRDGKNFVEQASAPSKGREWQGNWLACEPFRTPARYVRVQVRMPGSGYIDEIEIWGRKMAK